jgi:hypothetical protein
MDEVRLPAKGGCVGHISQEMRLGVDTLLRIWKGRNCCLRFEVVQIWIWRKLNMVDFLWSSNCSFVHFKS